jgi:hypothetical protein
LDPCYHELEAYCFIYSLQDSHEGELENHHVEEKVVVPMFYIDDIVDVADFPRYDEYNDDYEVDFME